MPRKVGLVLIGTILGNIGIYFLLMAIPTNLFFDINALAAQPQHYEGSLDTGDATPGISVSGTQSGTSVDNCLVSESFPPVIRQWCGLITTHAIKHSIEPNLVAALIWQESGGDPSAYSHSGAVGLMQVMPRDGLAADFICQNGPCFQTRPTIQELENPEFNIAFGVSMLAGLTQKFGDVREALKSYGPMDVGYYYADKVLGIYHQYGN